MNKSAAVTTIEQPATVSPMSDSQALIQVIERVAMSPDADIAKLEKMLDMQERIFNKNAELSFNAAMSRVQAEIKPVVRKADNRQTKSKYAKLETIVDAISPIYTSEGFALSFDTDVCPVAEHAAKGWFRVLCEVTHSQGHSKGYHVDLPPDMTGIAGSVNKTAIHGYKSTLSYGRNMLVCMIFNVVLKDEDDDGNAAGKDIQYISEDQLGELITALSAKGITTQKACEKLRIGTLAELEAVRFPLAMRMADASKGKAHADN